MHGGYKSIQNFCHYTSKQETAEEPMRRYEYTL